MPNVAVLGIGLMGNKIARRLAEKGARVIAWNRTADKAARLEEAGIAVAASPSEALAAADIVLFTLADAAAISAVLDAPGATAALAGRTIVQMGTIGPGESRALDARIVAAGGEYMEAPVLGSQPEAAAGTLLVMVGAARKPEGTAAWPVLCALGEQPLHIGEVGAAAAVKLALNQLIGALTIGFSSSLGLVEANGVDVDKFMSVLRPSALYAPTFDKKLTRMLSRDYGRPNFPTVHLAKDLRLFAAEAAAVGHETATLDALQAVAGAAVARGLGNTDYSAVYDAVTRPRLDGAVQGSGIPEGRVEAARG